MGMFWCGFNGFNQLNNEANTKVDFHIYDNKENCEEVQHVAFSWSTASILTSSGRIIISGLVNKRIVNFEVLNDSECGPFKSISTSESNVLAINTSGKCWSYLKTKGKWNNISQILQRNENVSTSVNQSHVSISDVCCSDTIHLAVAYNEIYSIPTKIFDFKLKVAQVACGFEHIIILMETGCLYTQGSSSRGQLGHGELNDEDYPRLLKYLDGIKVINISAGGWHSAVITDCNDLYMWGWNHSGQLGISISPENGGVMMAPEPVLISWTEETDIEQASVATKFRPLFDRVLVKRLDAVKQSKGGIMLPESASKKVLEATVIAVGPGARNQDGKPIPIDVQVGDRVLLPEYGGTKIQLDDDDSYTIFKESELLAKVE